MQGKSALTSIFHVSALLLVLSVRFTAAANAQSLPTGELTAGEVKSVIEAAVKADSSPNFYVVAVDRAGRILGAWQKPGATPESAERALSLARTGAFFSNDQAPLSSRTVRFISGIHFPPGIPYQPTAPLYGIENTNRGCDLNTQFNPGKDVPPSKAFEAFLRTENIEAGGPLVCNAFDQSGCGAGIETGKFSGNFVNGHLVNIPADELLDQKPFQVDGGGIPIFKGCRVVGGIGVFGNAPANAEYAALVGSLSGGPTFGPLACLPAPHAIFLDGVRLPFAQQSTRPAGSQPGPLAGGYVVSPRAGSAAPDGWLVGGPDQPLQSPELSPDDVQTIVEQAVNEANRTRAAIRLPPGSRARMVIAVSDLNGNLLGVYRMADATFFSIDVAVAKSRNVIYFSSRPNPDDLGGLPPGTAVSNRTVSFTSQPFYPPGIDGTPPGPSFDLFVRDVANACTQGFDPLNPLNVSGVVFFPGSLPLYKNGQLVGGLGVSGDGVEQDDLVSAAGAVGFEAPDEIRADNFFLRDVRLPYLKFPRNPYQ
jgi:uncharacterized protein GlcG (DUF336 family)